MRGEAALGRRQGTEILRESMSSESYKPSESLWGIRNEPENVLCLMCASHIHPTLEVFFCQIARPRPFCDATAPLQNASRCHILSS